MSEDTIFPGRRIQSKKFYVIFGAVLGLLTLGSAAYLHMLSAQTVLATVVIFLYISSLPLISNTAYALMRPLYIRFDRICQQRQMRYKIVHHFRSVGVDFAIGTAWRDRFKLGLLFNLIQIVDIIVVIGTFGVVILALFLFGSGLYELR